MVEDCIDFCLDGAVAEGRLGLSFGGGGGSEGRGFGGVLDAGTENECEGGYAEHSCYEGGLGMLVLELGMWRAGLTSGRPL